MVLLVLKSPRFLYREIGSKAPDGYDVASRLSFGLWDSLPDQALLDAAASGQLGTPRAGRHARPSAWSATSAPARKLRDLFLQWLKVDQVPDIAKDPKRYPQFNEVIASDLRTSLDLFLDEVIGSETADFRQLLRADYVYLNGRLAQFYGANLSLGCSVSEGGSGSSMSVPGVLTHPYLMASFAYTASSSPIHRGVFIATERPGPGAAAAARGCRPACARSPSRPDDSRTRDRADQARVVPVVPRDDQSAGIYSGALRCGWPIPKG